MSAFYIILAGSLVAASSSILGCYLIMRRMAMVGDAISHAVLPGIVIAYLLSGSIGMFPVLIGASALGVITTLLIEFIHKEARLQQDASIGISFTFFFAIGVILINVFARQVHIDQDCVLLGELAYVPLETWNIGGLNLGPTQVWMLSVVFVVVSLFVIIGYKGLLITTFDADFAKALGIKIGLWNYALMTLVSLNTVVSFEAVGVVLVIAFLVIPPATAYLLTHNFKKMLLLSVGIGILSAIGGYYLALFTDTSIAACMAVIAGCIFTTTLFFAPQNGVIAKVYLSKK